MFIDCVQLFLTAIQFCFSVFDRFMEVFGAWGTISTLLIVLMGANFIIIPALHRSVNLGGLFRMGSDSVRRDQKERK